jgi:hypothetical protein
MFETIGRQDLCDQQPCGREEMGYIRRRKVKIEVSASISHNLRRILRKSWQILQQLKSTVN